MLYNFLIPILEYLKLRKNTKYSNCRVRTVHRVHPTPTTLPIVTVPALATLGHAAAKHVLEQNVYSAAPSALLPKADKQWKSNLADIGKHHSTHWFTDSYLAGLPARSQWAEQAIAFNTCTTHALSRYMYFYNAVPNVRKRTIQHPPLHSTSSLSDLVPGYTHYSSLSPRHRSW